MRKRIAGATLGFLSLLIDSGFPQESGPGAGRRPEWIESNYTGTPPAEMMRSRKGHLELVSILGDKRFVHAPGVYGFAFNRDRTQVLSVSDLTYKVWDLATGRQVSNWSVGTTIYAFAFSPDGKYVAGGTHALTVWEAATGKVVRTLIERDAAASNPTADLPIVINDLAFTADGQTLLVGGDSTVEGVYLLQTWDPKGGKRLSTWKFGKPKPPPAPGTGLQFVLYERNDPGVVNSLAFSPDGKTVLFARDGIARLYETKTGKPVAGWPEARCDGQLALCADGTRAALLHDGTLEVLDLATRGTLSTSKAPDKMQLAALSPDGKHAAWVRGRSDEAISIRDIVSGQELTHFRPIGTMGQFSRDGKLFVAATGMGFTLWDVETGRQLVARDKRSPAVDALTLTSDGKRVLCTGNQPAWQTWDLATRKLLSSAPAMTELKLKLKNGYYNASGVSPDGRQALISTIGEAFLWDLETGHLLTQWDVNRTATHLAFSPDGKRALTLCGNWDSREIAIYDLNDYHQISRWPVPKLGSPVFSPDGKRVLMDGPSLWDADTGKLLAEWKDPKPAPVPDRGSRGRSLGASIVLAQAFSPDGNYVLSYAQSDKGYRHPEENCLWEIATGRPVAKWNWPRMDYCQVRAFTPDGKLAVLAGSDIMVLVDVKSGQELDEIALDGGLNSLAVYRDKILVGYHDGTVGVYRISAQEVKGPGAVREPKGPGAAQDPKEPDSVKKALAKLAGSPDDADANLTVGKYLFQLEKFDEAFPYFAKGSDGAFKALGDKELSKDPDATSLGGEWAEASKKHAPLRPAMMDRAVFWCAKAWLKADDQEKAKLRPILRKVASPPVGFEKAGNKKSENIEGWNVISESTSSYIDDLFAHTGKRSAKVLPAGKDARDGLSWVATQNVPAAAGKVYKASAWFFTEGTDADGSFDFEFSDSDGKRVLGARKPILMDCPFWRKIEVEATAPEGTIRTFVNFWVKSKRGALWVDDVSIQQDGKELLKNGGLEGR